MNDDRLFRYVTRDMTAEERSAFEACLRDDAALREELASLLQAREEARDWFDQPAPGEERVEDLRVPRISATHRRVRATGVLVRVAAAILLFAAGFSLGMQRRDAATGQTSVPLVASPGTTPVTVATPATESPSPTSLPEPEPPETPATISATEENGRVIVQTILRSSGTRATWIVDGGFQIAQSASSNQ